MSVALLAAFALCTLLGAAACRRVPSVAACAVPPAISTTNWKSDSGGAFFVRVPPGFERRPMQGLDSEAGNWIGGQATIAYDFGAFSDPLTNEQYAGGVSCDVRIGGRPAHLVMSRTRDGRFFAGAHWKGFGDAGIGPVSLTINAVTYDSLARDSVVASLWTVTFRPQR